MKSPIMLATLAGFILWSSHAQEKKKVDVSVERIPNHELRKLAGSWEMKVVTKDGWKGTIYLFIAVGPPGSGKFDRLGPTFFDGKLSHDGTKKTVKLINSLCQRPFFSGVKKGELSMLVSEPRKRAGEAIEVEPQFMTPFKLEGDKMTLDMSQSAKFFLPDKLLAVDLDFSKMLWTRTDKAGPVGGK